MGSASITVGERAELIHTANTVKPKLFSLQDRVWWPLGDADSSNTLTEIKYGLHPQALVQMSIILGLKNTFSMVVKNIYIYINT